MSRVREVNQTLTDIAIGFYGAFKEGHKTSLNVAETQHYADWVNLKHLRNNPIQVIRGAGVKRIVGANLGGEISRGYKRSLERFFSSGFQNRLHGTHV